MNTRREHPESDSVDTQKRLAFAALTLLLGCTGPSVDDQLTWLKTERESYLKRVDEVTDKALCKDISQMARIVFWMRKTAIEQQRQPTQTTYGDSPLRVVDDYHSLESVADNYSEGLLATRDTQYQPDYAEVKRPFEYPFAHKLTWKSVTLDDGTTLPVLNDRAAAAAAQADETGPIAVYPGSFGRLRTISHGDDTPSSMRQLDGVLTLAVPEHIRRITFGIDETGRTAKADGFAVKLVALNGHQATVSIKPDTPAARKRVEALDHDFDDMVKFVARDDSGRSTGPPGFEKNMLKMLDVIKQAKHGKSLDSKAFEKKVEHWQQTLLDKHDDAMFINKTFRGPIDQLDVMLIGASGQKARKSDISLRPAEFSVPRNTKSLVAFPTRATIYDHSLDDLDKDQPSDLDKDAMASQISVEQTACSDKYGETPATVEINYPDVLSNYFKSVFER